MSHIAAVTHQTIRVDPATALAAALHVCSAAVDVDDAEVLLQALGLLPYVYDERLTT